MIENLFTQALGLTAPWVVREVRFAPEQRRIDFAVTAQRGAGLPALPVVRATCRCTIVWIVLGVIWISSSSKPSFTRRCPG